MNCVFNGVFLVPGVRLDNNTIICEAPPGGDDLCEGRAVEVTVMGFPTSNGVKLRRTPTPKPVIALNSRGDPTGWYQGNARDSRWVRVCVEYRADLPIHR